MAEDKLTVNKEHSYGDSKCDNDLIEFPLRVVEIECIVGEISMMEKIPRGLAHIRCMMRVKLADKRINM